MKIAIAGIKGGTGKTTTAAALAQAAAKDGLKVLAVDLDPQCNLTTRLGAEPGEGSYQAMTGEPAPKTQQTEQGIDVLASTADLAALRIAPGAAQTLEKALAALQYDLIIIDAPPTAGLLVYSALQASDTVLVPLESDLDSLQGLYQIVSIAAELKVPVLGAVLTRYNSRTKINQHVAALIQDACTELSIAYYGGIRQGVAVRESQALQKSLFEYAARSGPAQDYWNLYLQIMGRA